MTSTTAALAAFIAGAAYELCCVFWVHHSERGAAGKTAAWSMLAATCEVTGIGQSIAHLSAAVAFVVGYGAGSFLGVAVKQRLR